jgi:3-deoxy-D-manno-octulosonate 8-phosphate phosphatase (KDO 8-P phosphatase)
MKLIAHRGNISGSQASLENDPTYLEHAMEIGYDVEMDVWFQQDAYYTGHDKPTYKIDKNFLKNSKIWVHCKDEKTFYNLSKYVDINCFLQEGDKVAITTKGFLWNHSSCKEWDERSVFVNLGEIVWGSFIFPYAVCSDYVDSFKLVATQDKLPFDLLIIDIDGVMTDGTKIYDRDGKVFGKKFCDRDFTAIKRLKASGIEVCFLSGDLNVNKEMAESRKIDFFHNPPGTDKEEILPQIKDKYKTDNIAYVGDDYYDIAIMKSVKLSFCTYDSPCIVKRAASFILPIESGRGVIECIVDRYEHSIPIVYPKDSVDVNPK